MRNVQWTDVDSDHAVRYLGIFLGSDGAVARKWVERVAGRLTARLASLRTTRGARTWYGRVTVLKTLVFSIANFYIMNQTPPNLKHLLDQWWAQLWRFFWDTPDSSRQAAWLVKADTIVQNHVDGGIRALHPALFAESLRLTWVRRLLDPTPQVWKNLVWEHINDTYGVLAQGELLFVRGDTVKIRFFRRFMRSKPPIPVNSSLLVDIKTTQDHNLIQSLTRTLDRQSLKFLHEAQNAPHTAAARLSPQLKAEQSDLSVPQLHSLLS